MGSEGNIVTSISHFFIVQICLFFGRCVTKDRLLFFIKQTIDEGSFFVKSNFLKNIQQQITYVNISLTTIYYYDFSLMMKYYVNLRITGISPTHASEH